MPSRGWDFREEHVVNPYRPLQGGDGYIIYREFGCLEEYLESGLLSAVAESKVCSGEASMAGEAWKCRVGLYCQWFGISDQKCGLGTASPVTLEHLLTSPTEKAFIRILVRKNMAFWDICLSTL